MIVGAFAGDRVARTFADVGAVSLSIVLGLAGAFLLFVALSDWSALAKAGVLVWVMMP